MRFHTQTAGSTLTAQQPDNNVVRTTVQAMAAVLGGTQSLHTNAFDEALGLPTEASARLALRTQQILAYESGMTDTVDPLAGSYFIEALTDELEAAARSLLDEIEQRGRCGGGNRERLDAISDRRGRLCGGQAPGGRGIGGHRGQQVRGRRRRSRCRCWQLTPTSRPSRSSGSRSGSGTATRAWSTPPWRKSPKRPGPTDNLLYPMKEALVAGATVGEVSGALRAVFGAYRP